MVPSFFAPTFTRAYADGRAPATLSSASRSSMMRTGLPSAFLEICRGKDSPAIRRKLAAKTSAYVVLVNADVAGGSLQRFCHLPGNSGNILSGDVCKQMIGVGPLGDGTMAFQAAVCNYRNAVESFRNHFGLRESLVRIAQSLLRRLLIV